MINALKHILSKGKETGQTVGQAIEREIIAALPTIPLNPTKGRRTAPQEDQIPPFDSLTPGSENPKT